MQTVHATAALASRRRAAGACAAFAASASVLGLLMTLFAGASSNPWLPDTPEAVALAARCEQAASRMTRDACVLQAAARWQAAERQGIRVASSR